MLPGHRGLVLCRRLRQQPRPQLWPSSSARHRAATVIYSYARPGALSSARSPTRSPLRPPTFQLTHPLARHPLCTRSSIHPCANACTRARARPRTHSSIRSLPACLPARLLVCYLAAGPPACLWVRTSILSCVLPPECTPAHTSAPSRVLLPARTLARGHAHALPSACATACAPTRFIVCLRAPPPPAPARAPTSHRRRHRCSCFLKHSLSLDTACTTR